MSVIKGYVTKVACSYKSYSLVKYESYN